MKKLTKEDKARRYDEVSKEVKDFFEGRRKMQSDVTQTLEYLFPELIETDDEKIRKGIIRNLEYLYDRAEGFVKDELKERIAWLEKQCGHKSTDKIQIGKEYKCIASPRYTMFMTGKIYKPEDKFLCSLMNFCSDCFEPIEDSEQIDLASNIDKVEPKFKDGDWIVYKDDVWKVCNIALQNCYELLKINNEVSTRLIKDVDENAHLWTIEDAKPGDIIYAESKFNTFDFIEIFYTIGNGNLWCYCEVSSDSDIYSDDLDCWEFDSDKGFVALDRYNFYPASKKQRHLLYQKMKDAGYEWDTEKKKLKDI